MNISQTQSTSTSIAWQYNSNVEVTPKGLINETGNRYYLNYFPIPTVYLDPNHAMCEENRSNAIKLGMNGV